MKLKSIEYFFFPVKCVKCVTWKGKILENLTYTQKTTRRGKISLSSDEIPYWLSNMNEEDIPENIQPYIHKQQKRLSRYFISLRIHIHMYECVCIYVCM